MKRLTKAEIIDETVAFYSEDPQGRRAVTSVHGGCSYVNSNGCKCAVGRCLSPEGLDFVMENHKSDFACNIPRLEDHLATQYRGHHRDFWVALQVLHDESRHWNGELSRRGDAYLTRLRADHS